MNRAFLFVGSAPRTRTHYRGVRHGSLVTIFPMRVNVPKRDALRTILQAGGCFVVNDLDIDMAVEIANHANNNNSHCQDRPYATKLADAIYSVGAERYVLENATCFPDFIARGEKKKNDLNIHTGVSVFGGRIEIKAVKDSGLPPTISGQTYDWKIVFQREQKHYNQLIDYLARGLCPNGLTLGLWAPKVFSISEPLKPIVLDFEDGVVSARRLSPTVSSGRCSSDATYAGWCVRK